MMAYRRTSTSPQPSRVVITGIGLVTSLGQDWSEQTEAFRTGRRGLISITAFDTTRQRVHQGGEVTFPETHPTGGLTARQISRLDRATRLLVMAGLECQKAAGWPLDGVDEAIPFVFGTSAAAMSLGEAYYLAKTQRSETNRALAHLTHLYQPSSQVRILMDALGLHGPSTIIANACASGSNAIGQAFHLIRSGRARRVVTGGYDGLSLLVFAGFDSLQALSTTQPRPFAADRDGLALGEGAAVLTLERHEDAIARGATLWGEIVGYGSCTDLHHLTQPHPDGDAALASMNQACQEAGWDPFQVDYINAHGTGTVLNDSSEASAIQRWAGQHVGQIRVSSTKGSTGHLLGGAGAVEAAICCMALQGQWLPPNVPVPNIDPICQFQLVQNPMQTRVTRVLSNSFGFGGANATIAIQHA